jgi:hypothetical protein
MVAIAARYPRLEIAAVLRANGMRWPSELGKGSQVRNRLAGGARGIRTPGPGTDRRSLLGDLP